jgi:hypothetical protein
MYLVMCLNWPQARIGSAAGNMSATPRCTARSLATLTAALLLALPAVGRAQDAAARPSLAALAATRKAAAATAGPTSQTAHAAQPNKVLTIQKSQPSKTLAVSDAKRRSAQSSPSHTAPIVPSVPRPTMERARIIPYQPIRAGRPSVPSVLAPVRPNPAAPSSTAPRPMIAPARGGTE